MMKNISNYANLDWKKCEMIGKKVTTNYERIGRKKDAKEKKLPKQQHNFSGTPKDCVVLHETRADQCKRTKLVDDQLYNFRFFTGIISITKNREKGKKRTKWIIKKRLCVCLQWTRSLSLRSIYTDS